MHLDTRRLGVPDNATADDLRHRALVIRLHAISIWDDQVSRELEVLADELEASAAEREAA
jgi:hypothetical protein